MRRHRPAIVLALLLITAGAYVLANSKSSQAGVQMAAERHPQTAWAPCNRNARNGGPSTFVPLSDAQAASLVTHQREIRPYNAKPYTLLGKGYPAPNDYVPTAAQINRFRHSRTETGESLLAFNPYLRYVDGRDGIRDPSTDDLIQWSAHKWGIPEDWLRAEYVRETGWDQYYLGDETAVSSRWYDLYPYQSRIPHSLDVYESLGITQVKWTPDGSINPGTEPLRWESTAFNLDLQAATIRFYYDNPEGRRSAWGDASYVSCEKWNSIGGWYRPYPWGNGDQQRYVHAVQEALSSRTWASRSFVNYSPPSFPRGISFR